MNYIYSIFYWWETKKRMFIYAQFILSKECSMFSVFQFGTIRSMFYRTENIEIKLRISIVRGTFDQYILCSHNFKIIKSEYVLYYRSLFTEIWRKTPKLKPVTPPPKNKRSFWRNEKSETENNGSYPTFQLPS